MLVSSRFHVLFHSPPGVLFTFPSRYCFTIGHTVVLSLTRWSSQIHTEFHVLRATRDTARSTYLSITGLSPSVARHSNVSSRLVDPYCCPTTPIVKTIGLGYSPFARHYLGSHYCFPFLRLLRCFSSPGWPLHPMFSGAGDRSSTCQVFPFGNPRIDGYLPLPAAYRSLSRPSSPSRAKASTVCS